MDAVIYFIGLCSVLILCYTMDNNNKLNKQIKEIERWQRNQKR